MGQTYLADPDINHLLRKSIFFSRVRLNKNPLSHAVPVTRHCRSNWLFLWYGRYNNSNTRYPYSGCGERNKKADG